MKIKSVVRKTVSQICDIEFDGLTLLSKKEYEENRKNIEPIDNGWWLRSPGCSSSVASFVGSDGSLSGSSVYNTTGSVRPALILNSSDLKIGDRFSFCNHNWTVISTQYALCDEAICEMQFRENYNAFDANVYKASDIKKYLDSVWHKMIALRERCHSDY